MRTTIHESLEQSNTYILGSRKPQIKTALYLGRFYALDGSLGSSVYLDVSNPHVVLIAGKRGYGKSYTMGVFLEEFFHLPSNTRRNYSGIVIDTLGIFWTLIYPNDKQKSLLDKWGSFPKEIDINIRYTAQKKPSVYDHTDNVNRLQIPPHLLRIDQWCHLFQISIEKPEGMLLSRAIINLQSTQDKFSLTDIKNQLYTIPHVKTETIHSVENLLLHARSWNLFSSSAELISSLVQPGKITIVDLSDIKGTHLKQSITGIIAELLFYYRISKRKIEEYNQIKKHENNDVAPYVWLAIDEAHLFLPQQDESYVKKVLLHNWLRQGRQPGLSVILATQRPSFMDQEVLSHCDIVLCHRLTADEDIRSLTRLRPTYMKGDIKETIKQIGTEKGVALLIDDVVETAHIIRIRPRYSWHGGGEPSAYSH